MAGNSNSGRKPGYKQHENARSRIKAGMIMARMQEDFFADPDQDAKKPRKGQHKPLSELQVKIGFGLLRKVIPDLQSVTLAGDAERPLVTEIVERIVDPKDKA